MSLRARITCALVLAAAAPVIALGWWAGDRVVEAEKTKVEDKHLLLADNAIGAFDAYARDIEAGFAFLLDLTARGQSTPAAEAFAARIGFQHFCIVGEDGTVISSVPGSATPPLEVPAERVAALSKVASDGAPGGWRLTTLQGAHSILLAQRLSDGQLAVGAIRPDYLREIQRGITFGQKGHAAVVDAAGTIIAHPKAEWEAEAKSIAKLGPVQRMMAGERGATEFYSPALKADMVVGYTASERTGWGVMVPQPVVELEEAATHVWWVAALMVAIALAGATLIALGLSGVLVAPIERVIGATRRFTSGETSARAPTSGGATPPELRELALTFNQMADEVERRHAQLTADHEFERDELLAAIASNIPGLVFRREAHPDGRVAYPLASLGAENALRISLHEERRFSLEAVIDEEDRASFAEAMAASAKGLSSVSRELRIRGEDGETRWARLAASPRARADGAIVWDGVLLDVTALIAVEQELRQAHDTSETVSRAKSDFFANVSHDLKTPLNAILGFSEMMTLGVHGALDSRYREYAELIHRSASHLLQLIGRLLELARVESGAVELEEREVDLGVAAQEALDLLVAQAAAREVKLTVEPAAEPVVARVDPLALRQILLNLGSNAVKFSRRGGRVTAAITRNDAGAAIEIRDQGVGIAPIDLDRVVERFNRGESGNATPPVHSGVRGQESTGLGLSIAKSLTELHGGSMTIESRPGVGTTVRVLLPNTRLTARRAA